MWGVRIRIPTWPHDTSNPRSEYFPKQGNFKLFEWNLFEEHKSQKFTITKAENKTKKIN